MSVITWDEKHTVKTEDLERLNKTLRGIPVAEIFGPTISGEGSVLGIPTVFVRTGGCDYRCSWCDSLHAVMPQHKGEWASMQASEILDSIRQRAKPPFLITLSGGNPAMHQRLGDVVVMGQAAGYTFNIETQGTISQVWFRYLDWVTISPKPPSSGMGFDIHKLSRCLQDAQAPRQGVSFKIPIFDETDLEFALQVQNAFEEIPLYLSVGNPNPPPDTFAGDEWTRKEHVDPRMLLARYDWLAQIVLERGINARVTPQMHVLVWSNKRGV